MTLLSRKADYALLILSYLHGRTEGGNARAVAERFGLSRSFVANILKELCHKGFVFSHRGVKGGYTLLRPASAVTLAELLTALDDSFQLSVCSTHGGDAAAGHDACDLEAVCPMKGPISEIHRRLTAVLRGVTLAELFTPGEATPAVFQLSILRPVPAPAEPALA